MPADAHTREGGEEEQQGATPSGPGLSRIALLPIDDATRSLNDSILPSVMIWDGGDAYEQLLMRNALPATDPRSLDLDACAIAVGIYRVMTAAAEKAFTPAPRDGSGRAGETEGLDTKCDSAVDEASSEVEAPASQDLEALQAEIERLKGCLMAWREGFYTALRQRDDARDTLAESERKRAEAEADLADALATRDILARTNADLAASWVENSTPNQETPDVTG